MEIKRYVCNKFMYNNCTYTNCKFLHDESVCFYFWKNKSCREGENCKKTHIYVKGDVKGDVKSDGKGDVKGDVKGKRKKNKDKYNKNKIKNTVSFDPIDKATVDMRIVLHTVDDKEKFDEKLTGKDVLLVPDLFKSLDITYDKLLSEIKNAGLPEDKLFKLWHGDSHVIADDHLDWKQKCPTFNLVIDKIRNYFNLDIKATRFNLYKDTSQFKPMHFDSSAVKPHVAKIQNFTLAVSFGATREAAFEKAAGCSQAFEKSNAAGCPKTIISLPQKDGYIYAFCKDTNINWRHGILQDIPVRNEGRISIICWGHLEQS